MLKYLGRRLAVMVPTILLVLLFLFLFIELQPGDPAQRLAGEQATEETVAQIRSELGLDRPVIVRFGEYVGEVVRGDLGVSLYTRRPVLTTIVDSLAITGSLALVSLVLTVLISFVGGTIAGLRPGSVWDRIVSGSAALGLALPPFVFALILVVPLAIQNRFFPATGYAPLSEGFGTWLHHLFLPALALAVNSAAELTRQVRGALVETMEKDFIRTGRAMGLSTRAVVGRHAARNSAIPVVTVTGLQVARILGAAVIIEQVFAMPGFGSVAFTAVFRQDIPVILGLVLVSAVIVLITNLLVDLSYAYFNPRLRT